MSSISAAGRATEFIVWLLGLTLGAQGQNTRPDFTGVWRSVSVTPGSPANSVIKIKQTDSGVALQPLISNQPASESIYSTDGKVMRTKIGRHLLEKSGHWAGNRLILEETAPGNAPWRRSTEQRTLSLSGGGARMTMKVHNLSDKKCLHDYTMEWERFEH